MKKLMVYARGSMKNVSGNSGMRWIAILAVFIVATSALVIPSLSRQAYAATGSMYLTGTSSVAHGGTVSLQLRINPGTPVTVTQSSITYDASKLQYAGISYAGSAFDTKVSQSQSSGSIEIDRALLDSGGVSTDALIATITFTALPYSGSSAVNLVPPSNAAYNGTYTNPSLSGKTVSFTPGSCPSGQTGTPPNCTTVTAPSGGGGTSGTTSGGGGSTTTTTPSNTSGSSSSSSPSTSNQAKPSSNSSSLAVPTIASTDFQYTMATIKVTTNVAAQVQVKYGLSADTLSFQAPLTQSGTTHTVTLNQNLPIATTIYYQVVATDGKTTKTTDVQNTKTKGPTVNILLLDEKRTALSGRTVSVNGEQAKSSRDGYVTFNDLAPGDHEITLKVDDKTYKETFTVLSNITTDGGTQTTPAQNIFVTFHGYTYNMIPGLLIFAVAGIIVVAGLGVGGVLLWRRRHMFHWKHTGIEIEGLIASGTRPKQNDNAAPVSAASTPSTPAPTPQATPHTSSLSTPSSDQAPYNPFANDLPPGPRR